MKDTPLLILDMFRSISVRMEQEGGILHSLKKTIESFPEGWSLFKKKEARDPLTPDEILSVFDGDPKPPDATLWMQEMYCFSRDERYLWIPSLHVRQFAFTNLDVSREQSWFRFPEDPNLSIWPYEFTVYSDIHTDLTESFEVSLSIDGAIYQPQVFRFNKFSKEFVQKESPAYLSHTNDGFKFIRHPLMAFACVGMTAEEDESSDETLVVCKRNLKLASFLLAVSDGSKQYTELNEIHNDDSIAIPTGIWETHLKPLIKSELNWSKLSDIQFCVRRFPSLLTQNKSDESSAGIVIPPHISLKIALAFAQRR